MIKGQKKNKTWLFTLYMSYVNLDIGNNIPLGTLDMACDLLIREQQKEKALDTVNCLEVFW